MNECTKCNQGFITIWMEDGRIITVLCDSCGGYSEHEDVAK
jgi:hypothetical protein